MSTPSDKSKLVIDKPRLKRYAELLEIEINKLKDTEKDVRRLSEMMREDIADAKAGSVREPRKTYGVGYWILDQSNIPSLEPLCSTLCSFRLLLDGWKLPGDTDAGYRTPGDDWKSFEIYRVASMAMKDMQKAARLLRSKLEDAVKADRNMYWPLSVMAPWLDTINAIDNHTLRVEGDKQEYITAPETEAHTVLGAMAPWFDAAADAGEPSPPQEGTFMWHLLSAQSPLSKDGDLARLRQDCATAIKDWFFKARWDGWESPEAQQAAQLAFKRKADNTKAT